MSYDVVKNLRRGNTHPQPARSANEHGAACAPGATAPGSTDRLPARIARLAAQQPDFAEFLTRLLRLSVRGLPRMFRPERGLFAFTRKRNRQGACPPVGTSMRYGAIVCLGAAGLDIANQRAALAGQTAADFCSRLLAQLDQVTNLGDAALITWASAELNLPGVERAAAQLAQRFAHQTTSYTVETAWTLSALVAAAAHADRRIAQPVRDRLLDACDKSSGLFAHWTAPAHAPWLRAHVACFADQVYPIQALARWHRAVGDAKAITCAVRCAEQICRLQGKAGQWWWHYDIRTGEVSEGYPVYTIHQDAMAPMALLDLQAAGGPDFTPAIARGLAWVQHSPEIDRSLIDTDEALIWRSVRRSDRGKLVRKLRTVATRISPRLRLRSLNRIFPPVAIDFEDRPYHLGWLLYAWLTSP